MQIQIKEEIKKCAPFYFFELLYPSNSKLQFLGKGKPNFWYLYLKPIQTKSDIFAMVSKQLVGHKKNYLPAKN